MALPENAKTDSVLMEAYHDRAIIYLNELDKLDSAIVYFYKVKERCTPSSVLFGKSLLGIGTIYGLSNQKDSAINILNSALTIFKKHNKSSYVIRSLYELGICHYDVNVDSALICFNKVRDLSYKHGNEKYKANSHRAIGQIYSDTDELDSAYYHNEKALEIFELDQEEYHYDLCNLYLGMALLESRRGFFKEAIFYADKSNDIASKYSYLHIKKNVYDVLTEVYYTFGDCDRALENLQLKYLMADSINSISVQKSIEVLSLKNQVLLKQKEHNELINELETTRLNKRNNTLMFVVLLLTLIVLGCLAYLFVRRRQINFKEKILEVSNQNLELKTDLDNFKDDIDKKDEAIKYLKQDISTDLAEETKINILLNNLQEDQEWGRFLIAFEVIYPSFLIKLKHVCEVSLTKNDIKFAALSRLNLSNKEMANLLCISDAAVKKGKSRLSKKINLEKGEKLHQYLSKIA